ncbi:HD-GYP domain-containing protein [Methylobrevis albus]|uniref:HD domain-containing protein n=1 Tax=Methylobrevis albus TaxID=2793297 RepID=A0A931I2R6_9HYPH|nr:HD-GYP domain-containing protein [Methylobrevis albus]MBH0238201.1 HD domain-containing protein [Methylobrevis albus]
MWQSYDRRRRQEGGLGLAEILGAFSHALDLTEGQPAGHCMRACWIGYHVGRELGMPAAELGELYYAILLKDLGCSSNAARICSLYLVDDLAFKRDFKQIDGSLPAALRFVLGHTGLKSGLAERFRAIIHILQNGGEIARELIETRCERGAAIARKMRFSEAVAIGIRDLDEHWNGGGKPSGLAGAAIHPYARVALLAQVADVFFTSAGPDAALREIKGRRGDWFDPAVVDAFARAARRDGFWPAGDAAALEAQLFSLPPAHEVQSVDDDYLDEIATAFSEVIDAKSPFTAGHSRRVALFSDMIAEELGLADDHRRWLRRAALLHDIGKLGVSNAILDKPGKPDEEEWTALRSHAALTETILLRIAAFGDMAAVAAAHHERLDGRGYPRGLAGAAIALESRILMAADIFDALTAERPYRGPLPISKALAIMRADLGIAIDPVCFAALEAGLARLDAAAA